MNCQRSFSDEKNSIYEGWDVYFGTYFMYVPFLQYLYLNQVFYLERYLQMFYFNIYKKIVF